METVDYMSCIITIFNIERNALFILLKIVLIYLLISFAMEKADNAEIFILEEQYFHIQKRYGKLEKLQLDAFYHLI